MVARAHHGIAGPAAVRGILATTALVFCTGACAAAQSCPPLREIFGNSHYALSAANQDTLAARDMRRGLEAALVRIPLELGQPLTHRITIDMYPDQACYDRNVMDEHSRGTPAISGSWRIQMVSPRSAIRVQGIPYVARLEFVDHEIAHLVLNEINRSLPMWLVEGIPTYEGSGSVYRMAAHRYVGGKIPLVSFRRLVDDYASLPGADVLSFTAVQYIAERYGREKLKRLIRTPAALESVLGVSLDDFDRGWQQYLRTTYEQSRR